MKVADVFLAFELEQVALLSGSANYPLSRFRYVPGKLSHDTRVAFNLLYDLSKRKANTPPASDH